MKKENNFQIIQKIAKITEVQKKFKLFHRFYFI